MPQHPYICYGDALCRASCNACRCAGRAYSMLSQRSFMSVGKRI
ncbi:hypothetical protein BACUNI_04005 [Bacteroides uniformis ATCC 8492]|uniref:Uncharacterized protein n=1 Tax=Bacteroides uniformis (strain ATCC 8492 / DSM 6597 / CCUG 4942 / CIP 103695 / JCM 5828 / KCTC 5204 / NCTC 13054 / VPI 0061) TaxID=411479 RepID=A0ABC9N794_BACUC|nr:hypothetical protein BACUNI_04005 [Bacteroides uniformis ATCC 8492]